MLAATAAVLFLFLGTSRGLLVPGPPAADAVTHLHHDLFTLVHDMWGDVGNTRWEVAVRKTGSEPAKELHQNIADFGAKLDEVAINMGLQKSVDQSKLLLLEPIWLWAQIEEQLVTIDGLYKTWRSFEKRSSSDQHQWTDFASTALSKARPGSVSLALERLHDLLTKDDGGGLLKKLPRKIQEAGDDVCALEQSPQQLIYNLYSLVALTELKGYAMMQFSWMILRQYNKGNFTAESELMKQRTEQRALEKAAAAREAMTSASRLVWRCDPKVHTENVTFVQLTELLQGQIQNEVDLNPYSTCRESCAYYSYAKVHGCYHNQYCAKQRRCNGRLFNCQYIDSDAWVCPSSDPTRRYDWIEYENGRMLGRRDACTNGFSKVDSWWRWLFWHCSYCFCVCDEQGPKSDRYFSLRSVIADIAAGKVVTGLRFIKMQRVIHAQVQEAKVKPRGLIDETTVRWKPVDTFRVENAAPGIDYHTMTYEQRAMDLDDLVAPEGYVLTGFRFRRIGTHLNPEILATPIDMETGKLMHDGSIWQGNDNTDAAISDPRTQVSIRSPDIPTRSASPSHPDSQTDQFVLFTHSDMNKDAAQTTVPFIDSQAVAPSPPTLLAGAGIYHKGRSGYGGFVAIRLVTYDFTGHLGVNTTDVTVPDMEAPNVV